MKFLLETNFLVVIGSKLFSFCEQIHLIMYESVLMLYHILFYKMFQRPYILESYIFSIIFFFFSFSHLSIYPYPFFFFVFFFVLFDNKSKELFMPKEISVATMIGLK